MDIIYLNNDSSDNLKCNGTKCSVLRMPPKDQCPREKHSHNNLSCGLISFKMLVTIAYSVFPFFTLENQSRGGKTIPCIGYSTDSANLYACSSQAVTYSGLLPRHKSGRLQIAVVYRVLQQQQTETVCPSRLSCGLRLGYRRLQFDVVWQVADCGLHRVLLQNVVCHYYAYRAAIRGWFSQSTAGQYKLYM